MVLLVSLKSTLKPTGNWSGPTEYWEALLGVWPISSPHLDRVEYTCNCPYFSLDYLHYFLCKKSEPVFPSVQHHLRWSAWSPRSPTLSLSLFSQPKVIWPTVIVPLHWNITTTLMVSSILVDWQGYSSEGCPWVSCSCILGPELVCVLQDLSWQTWWVARFDCLRGQHCRIQSSLCAPSAHHFPSSALCSLCSLTFHPPENHCTEFCASRSFRAIPTSLTSVL